MRQIYNGDQSADAEPLGFAGQPNEAEGEGTPLFVMAEEDGQWLLVACQNTGVLDA